MNAGPPLTDHEFQILSKFVEQSDAAARKHRQTLTTLLVSAMITGGLGVTALMDFWSNATRPVDVVARLKKSDGPSEAPPHLWAVAEARRAAAMLQADTRIQMMATLEGVTGLLLVAAALFSIVHVRFRWNDGERREVLAKVGRWQLTQWRSGIALS